MNYCLICFVLIICVTFVNASGSNGCNGCCPCRLIKKKGPSFIANRMENLIGDMDRVAYPQAHICGEEWD
ncbi:hypothetical protein D915_001043 [Fasciola hepatica]|uniref:Uncharacterized protein n=1 Tax=Fasciola hepatica TaxID=6192 RepID=A0A4E0RZH1_FASHE|nr:hypothetical protein D915_001043 [Fasciola hepatica]